MWEDPTALWRRLKLGREEYVQRLMTTLILDGHAPPWNTVRSPGPAGRAFLGLLDQTAYGASGDRPPVDRFVDEYCLPKLEDHADNGWPDWAVLWPDRVWIIELKTEASSHRPPQLPYYSRLAAAAHPGQAVDLTYLTGPLNKPAPSLNAGHRYSHLTWDQVAPLVEDAWRDETRSEARAYVGMVQTVLANLGRLSPIEQRAAVLDAAATEVTSATTTEGSELLDIARRTAADGRQRTVGATDPEHLEQLRDVAVAEIQGLEPADPVRCVLPWLWVAESSGGRALTPEGAEFGYELRFSRYSSVQVRPGVP